MWVSRVVAVVWATLLAIPYTAAEEVCVSQGNRFPRFVLEGRPPRKSPRGADDIKLCRIYSGRTCCTATQTNQALLALRNLAVNGEGDGQCLALWEVVECSVCDPRVGTSLGPPVVCQDLCDAVFAACSSAFFSMDLSKQALLPCGSSEIVCARGTEWTRNSSHFCELAGFRVIERTSGQFCYNGKAEDPSATTGRSIWKERKAARTSKLKDLQKTLHGSSLMTDKVLWAIAGLVLTAGAVFLRQRGSRARHRRVVLMKTLKEARASQQAALNKNK